MNTEYSKEHTYFSYKPSEIESGLNISEWVKIEEAGMKIQENYNSTGITVFNDCVSSLGGSVLGIKRIFKSGTIDGLEFSDIEYEFDLEIALNDASPSHKYNLAAGFKNEGINGKCIQIGWFHTSRNREQVAITNEEYATDFQSEFLFSFIDGENGGPIFDISTVNWNDGKFHKYTVKKYRDANSNIMKIQVLVDGEPQLPQPLDYEIMPTSMSNETAFETITSSPSTGNYSIKNISCQTLRSVPGNAEKLFLIYTGIPEIPVTCNWYHEYENCKQIIRYNPHNKSYYFNCDTGNTAVYNSEHIAVTGHRNYKFTGKISGDYKCAILTIEQFNKAYPESDKPALSVELPIYGIKDNSHTTDFEVPFYIRKNNDQIVISIKLCGSNTYCQLDGVMLIGGGQYRPQFIPPQKDIVLPDKQVLEIVRDRKAIKANIIKENGRMTLLLDGKSVEPCFHCGPYITPDEIWKKGIYGLFRESGVKIQEIKISSQPLRIGKPAFWEGKNKYNFNIIDDYLWRVLKSAPDTYIMLGILVDPYIDWGIENPKEVCCNQYGQKAYGEMHLTGWGDDPVPGNRFLPSVFSEKVREDCSEMLGELVRYVESSEAGKAVIGYYIQGFNDADFGHWTPSGRKELDDYSIAAKNAYKRWLVDYYKGDVEKLKNAWKQKNITFETVEIPSEELRCNINSHIAPWFSAETHQEVADFNRFYYEGLAGLAAHFCSTVKRLTFNNKIIMTYAGTPMHGWKYSSGGFNKILEDNPADILASPADYGIRLAGYPDGYDTILDSHYLYNKIFFQEQDWRSFTKPTNFENYDFGVGRAASSEEHNAMVKRESGMMMARGQGTYFFDHSNAMYAHSEILKGVSEVVKVFNRSLQWVGRPEADVAFLLNEDSNLYLTDNADSFKYLMRLTRRHRPQWDTSGVPYHLYLQGDIGHAEFPVYKIYIFLSPEYLSDNDRAAIDKLKCDGNTLVFLHAPDLVRSSNPESSISKITGIKVRQSNSYINYSGRWMDTEHMLLKNLSGRFGDRPLNWPHCTDAANGVAFWVDDEDSIPLAKYLDIDEVAFALKDFGTWKSLFCGIPWLESQFINNLAHWSGAWCVSEPHDAIYADQHIVTIHSRVQGEKKIRLRYKSNVTDLTTGELVAEGVDEFIVNMGFGETRWFETVKCI